HVSFVGRPDCETHAPGAAERRDRAQDPHEAAGCARRGGSTTQPPRTQRKAASCGTNGADIVMSGEFEYAIRKDVRNNPIVREVDRERHLEMWRSAGVGIFL